MIVTTLMYCVNRDILSFESGYDLWAYLNGDVPLDIIITNTLTPDTDEFELMTRIKKRSPKSKLIIIPDSSDVASSAARFRADACLANPFGLGDLFEIVETFVVNAEK